MYTTHALRHGGAAQSDSSHPYCQLHTTLVLATRPCNRTSSVHLSNFNALWFVAPWCYKRTKPRDDRTLTDEPTYLRTTRMCSTMRVTKTPAHHSYPRRSTPRLPTRAHVMEFHASPLPEDADTMLPTPQHHNTEIRERTKSHVYLLTVLELLNHGMRIVNRFRIRQRLADTCRKSLLC